MNYPTTEDGRYFVHKNRLWRCTNPKLDKDVRQRLVSELMQARRDVRSANASGRDDQLKIARDAVNKAKVTLGERGPTWWDDDSDYNQCLVKNTPYADWIGGEVVPSRLSKNHYTNKCLSRSLNVDDRMLACPQSGAQMSSVPATAHPSRTIRGIRMIAKTKLVLLWHLLTSSCRCPMIALFPPTVPPQPDRSVFRSDSMMQSPSNTGKSSKMVDGVAGGHSSSSSGSRSGESEAPRMHLR